MKFRYKVIIFAFVLVAVCAYGYFKNRPHYYRKLEETFGDQAELELAKAVRSENVYKIKRLCKKHPEWIKRTYEEDYNNVLWLAASEAEEKSLKTLLDLGMNPNVKTKNGITPLYETVDAIPPLSPFPDYSNVIKILIDYGADCNQVVNDNWMGIVHSGATALMNVAYWNRIKYQKLLVEYGKADVNIKTEHGVTAAVVALWGNRIESAHYLICECKTDVKEPFIIEKYPLVQLYPVMLLRKFSFEPDTEEYNMLEEIKQEFRNQGIDNFDEEIPENTQNVLNESLPSDSEKMMDGIL